MILDGQQAAYLAELIDANSDLPRLRMYASEVGVNLPNLAPGVSLQASVIQLVGKLNSEIPPKTNQFLEVLRREGNAVLGAAANELLRPRYYPPTNDPHGAILLGRTAFVARDQLRETLREFTNPSPVTTRVLIVRGDEPGGKSYTWQFLRHLAVNVGANPLPLRLKNTGFTPREFFAQVFSLLRLDEKTLPELKDDPQLARIDTLLNAFIGNLHTLANRYWLVIDDLNDPSVTRPLREAAYALAYAVEDVRPRNLWVALLGYNDPFDESELRYVARDDAVFPSPPLVAEHLNLISQGSPAPLPPGRAEQIATVLFSKYPELDKEAMIRITIEVEKIGEILKQGKHP